MAKVYICNYAGYDYSSAREFGKLVPVTKGTVNIFKKDRLAYEISEALKEFNPREDFLLFGGNIVINVIAVTLLLSKHNEVACLVYGAKKGDYVPMTIPRSWPNLSEEFESAIDYGDEEPQPSHADFGHWNSEPEPVLFNHKKLKRR